MIEQIISTTHYSAMPNAQHQILPQHMRDEMDPSRIGYRLMLLRKAHNLEKSEIADMLGIERTYWSRFEGGKRAITDNVRAMLVDRFGVTMDFLILGRWDKLPLDLAEKLRDAAASSDS